MIAEVYWIKDALLVPTLTRTDAGFYLATEPVEVLRRPTEEALAAALGRVERRGNPAVPTPARDAFPEPVVLAHARVRSWAEFERKARAWTLEMSAAEVAVIPLHRATDGGFVDSPGETFVAHGEARHLAAARRLLESLSG